MHELGIMIAIIRQVEQRAKMAGVKRVEKIVLQVGALSGVVPRYLMECFPAAVYQTSLADCKLEIELIPAEARCNACGMVYDVAKHQGHCSRCHSREAEILRGKEFLIKELVVEDEDDITT